MTDATPSPRRGRRGQRRAFEARQVVDAALDLLDSGGPGALSVRAVAARLGVNPNAVYTYVPDRAALEREIVERVLGESDLDLLTGPTSCWRRRILGYAAALREVLLRHPGAVPLFMTAPMNGPTAVLVGEWLIDALCDAGLTVEEAARGAYLLIVHVIGSVALEVAETDARPPLPAEHARVAARRVALAGVDAAHAPRTAQAVDVMAAWITTTQFEWGLTRLLDGVVANQR